MTEIPAIIGDGKDGIDKLFDEFDKRVAELFSDINKRIAEINGELRGIVT